MSKKTNEKLTVLYLKDGMSEWEFIKCDQERNLPWLQGLVGGRIEFLLIEKDVAMFVNEEGHLLGLPVTAVTETGVPLVGPLVIFRCGRSGETLSAKPEDIKYTEHFTTLLDLRKQGM